MARRLQRACHCGGKLGDEPAAWTGIAEHRRPLRRVSKRLQSRKDWTTEATERIDSA
jgi:hypothetical protein